MYCVTMLDRMSDPTVTSKRNGGRTYQSNRHVCWEDFRTKVTADAMVCFAVLRKCQ